MKRVYQPKKRKRARAHGFLNRSKRNKKVLVRRRRKGRARLSA